MQTRFWLPVLVVLLVVLGTAVMVAQVRRQSSVRPTDGATLFHNYCAACHGPDGQGDGPAAKELKKTVPDLTRLSQRNGGNFPTLHVRTVIAYGSDELFPSHGSKEMPMWGPVFHDPEFDQDFGNVRLDNLTKYLGSIQKK